MSFSNDRDTGAFRHLRLISAMVSVLLINACGEPSSPVAEGKPIIRADGSIGLNGRVQLCVGPSSPAGSYTFVNTDETEGANGTTVFAYAVGVPYTLLAGECVDILSRTETFGPFDPFSFVTIQAQIPSGYATDVTLTGDPDVPPSTFTPPATVTALANYFHGTNVTYTFSVVPPADNTPSGGDVVVTPVDPAPVGSTQLNLTFENISSAGNTTVTSSLVSDPDNPAPPSGFQFGDPAVVYDIKTTAVFSGQIQLCFAYGSGAYTDESALRLLHYDNGTWVDITSAGYPDTTNHVICGASASLSPFVIGQASVPTVKAQCVKDAWRSHRRSDGTPFRNQGECVAYLKLRR